MDHQPFIQKSTAFVNNKIQELCYLYITERQKNKNELGCLIITFQKDNVNVVFSLFPILIYLLN